MQQALGIIPDMTTLAKIVSGGMPGGAVAGPKDVLDWLDFDVAKAKGRERIYHPGTFNANPVTAAAGVANIQRIARASWPASVTSSSRS